MCFICDDVKIGERVSFNYKSTCACGTMFKFRVNDSIRIEDIIDENGYLNHMFLNKKYRKCKCGYSSNRFGVICTNFINAILIKDVEYANN